MAACGSIGPEAQEPPPLASLLATPSPTPKPPSPSVVTAAVQAFVDGVNQAFRNGDLTVATNASTPTCKCRDQLASIAAVYTKHEHFIGTHIVVLHIVPTKVTMSTAQARVTVRLPASAIGLPNGKKKPLKARPAHAITATLVQQNGKWLVSSFVGLPRPEVTATPSPGSSPARSSSPSPSSSP
jgi:hypothetical protein